MKTPLHICWSKYQPHFDIGFRFKDEPEREPEDMPEREPQLKPQPKSKQSTMNTIILNGFWTATKLSPERYAAHRNDGETRLYFNREALERDFGPVTFPDEKSLDKSPAVNESRQADYGNRE